MKKSIFILAALFAATFANAQIKLEKTFLDSHLLIATGNSKASSWHSAGIPAYLIQAPCFYEQVVDGDGCKLLLYNQESLDLYKTVTLPDQRMACYITQNIFTTDGKIAFIYGDRIVNEDGQIFFQFDVDRGSDLDYWLTKIKGEYKLIVYETESFGMTRNYGRNATHIYSLPGNGEAQDIGSPSSQKRSARKIARDGQVLVETENNTFNLRGQEVK